MKVYGTTYIGKVTQDLHPLLDTELRTAQAALAVQFKSLKRYCQSRLDWCGSKETMMNQSLIDIGMLLILRYRICTIVSFGQG